MRARGVTPLLGTQTAAIEGGDRAEAVRLADGRLLPASLVVVAVGVKPSTTLAAAAGLTVDRGIVVDDTLATSSPHIHAIGECIAHRGVVYGLVEPGYAQAAVLARRLAGEDVGYRGSLLATRLKVSGVPVFSAGDVLPAPGAEVVILSDPAAGNYAKLVIRDHRLAGAILVGETRAATFYLDLITSGADVRAMRDELIFGPPGALAQEAPPVAQAA